MASPCRWTSGGTAHDDGSPFERACDVGGANPLGLVNVLGNLVELCRDFVPYSSELGYRPGDGLPRSAIGTVAIVQGR